MNRDGSADEIQPIPALPANAAGIIDRARREVDDLDEVRAGVFAGAAGGEVVGIAGDPEMGEAVAAGERLQKIHCTCGDMAAPEGLVHSVADVAGVLSEVLVPAEAEIDVAGFSV